MHRPCGGGVKTRRVECKQIMAQEHKVERRDELCPSLKPSGTKACNTKPCAPDDQQPPIASSNTTYIQHDPKKTKVTLKIGGAATVFLGTQIKIKCPVKRFVFVLVFNDFCHMHAANDSTRNSNANISDTIERKFDGVKMGNFLTKLKMSKYRRREHYEF